MMGHKICFYAEIRLIIPKLSRYPFLSVALVRFQGKQLNHFPFWLLS